MQSSDLLSSTQQLRREALICCRVYKNYDPRARIIKKVSDEVFAITGKDPLIQVSLNLVADMCLSHWPPSESQLKCLPNQHA